MLGVLSSSINVVFRAGLIHGMYSRFFFRIFYVSDLSNRRGQGNVWYDAYDIYIYTCMYVRMYIPSAILCLNTFSLFFRHVLPFRELLTAR